MRSRIVIILSLILGSVNSDLFAQQVELNGKVVDEITNLPLVGATVVLNDLETGTTTDQYGRFSIKIDSGDSISISFVGYKTLKFIGQDHRILTISMTPEDYTLNEVVINGYQGNRKLLETSGSVALITPKEIDLRNEPIITPLLNRIPGVYMHSGALNTNRITIRGIGARSPFSTRDIRAYLNEIPLTNGEGETTIEDIDLSLIGRAEVLRGPASTLFGAGLGGVINLKTKRTPFNTTSLDLFTRFGSYGLIQNSLSFQRSNNNHNTVLNINDTRSDGYRDNNNYQRRGAFLSSSISLSEKMTLNVLLNYTYLKAFIPSSLDSIDYVNNPQSAAFVWEQAQGFEEYDKLLSGLSLNTSITDRLTNTFSVFFGYQDQYERRFFNILEDRSSFAGFRTFFDLRARENDLFTLGIEFFEEDYDWRTFENDNLEKGDPLSDNTENRVYTNIFAQYQFVVNPRLRIEAGVNFNYTRYNYRITLLSDTTSNTGTKRFDNVVSPRLAINYQTTPNNALYFTISQGFTTPSLQESLLDDGTVNTQLSNEIGWNFELGTRGGLGNLFYDVSLFYMQVSDLLLSRQTPNDMTISVNAGSSNHLGLETSVRYFKETNGNIFRNYSIWGSYALMHYRFGDFVDGENDFSGNDLTGVPRHTLNIGVETELKCIYGQITYQYVSSIPINDANSVYSSSYNLVNLILGWKKSFGSLGFDIRGGVNNLFNEKYASMLAINARGFGGNLPRYYYPGLPINYYGDLRITYNF